MYSSLAHPCKFESNHLTRFLHFEAGCRAFLSDCVPGGRSCVCGPTPGGSGTTRGVEPCPTCACTLTPLAPSPACEIGPVTVFVL